MSQMGMQKISLFITNLNVGGAERVLVNMANELCLRGYEVQVVLAVASGDLLSKLAPEIRIVDLKASRIIKTLPRLISYLKAEKPHTLIAFMWPLTLIAIWAVRMAGLGKKTKVLVTEHCTWSMMSLEENCHQWFLKWSMRRFYPFAHAVIAVSKGARQDLLEFAQLKENKLNLKAIYNPVVGLSSAANPQEFFLDWSQGSHQKILAVGNLKDVKDYPSLIKAFKIVTYYKNVKLLILGEGEERAHLQLLIKNLGLEKNCFLYGKSNAVDEFYQFADVFVLSSKSEGLPTILIEALAHGVSVVSTDCPHGPHEILLGGKYGRLAPVGDIEKLAMEMINSLDFPDEKERLQERALYFSIPRAVDAYLAVLGEP